MAERRFEVLEAFAHEFVYYTRENEKDVAKLPAEKLEYLLANKKIKEILPTSEVPNYEPVHAPQPKVLAVLPKVNKSTEEKE